MSAQKKYYVKSAATMIGCYNLPTVDDRGRKMSLIISRNETSRPLSAAEFKSPEIQKGLKNRDLLDVTKKMSA